MKDVINFTINGEMNRKPLEALNVFSESNYEAEPHQSKQLDKDFDKSRVQLQNVCSIKKPYKCKFCSKLFSCPQSLELHTKWHLRNPYQCRFCECNFGTAPELTKHIQTHTEIELLVCDHCNKVRRCNTLNYSRQNRRRYTCESCSKCFSLRSLLVTHLRRHVRQKIFMCKLCNVAFAYSAQFRWHRTRCKQDGKVHKKDRKKKPCLRSYIQVKSEKDGSGANAVVEPFVDNLMPDISKNIKAESCNDFLHDEQVQRFDNDVERIKYFGGNFEAETPGNVNFSNQSQFDTEKSVRDDKSMILSTIDQEHLSGHYNLKNSANLILNTNSNNNLPNDPFLSKSNVFYFDVLKNGGHRQATSVYYPEVARQENQEVSVSDASEVPNKVKNLLDCSHCSRKFFFQESLDKHLKRNRIKRYSCTFCSQTFSIQSRLNAHLQKHTGITAFKCDNCELSFAYSTQLYRHKKDCYTPLQNTQTHKHPLGTVEESKNLNATSRLSYPGGNDGRKSHAGSITRGTLGGNGLNNIVGMFYPTDVVPPMISKVFSSDLQASTNLANAKENENYAHNMMPKIKVGELSIQEGKNLNNGVQVKITSKSLRKSLVTPMSANQTPKIDHPKPFPVSACDVDNVSNVRHPNSPVSESSKAKSRRNLSSNKSNTEKRFQCRSCGKFFSLAHNLKQHVRTHTGERPFKCDYCQARFSKSSILIVHLRRHTGEKPYGCKNCQRMFTHLTQLHRHLKVCMATDTGAYLPTPLDTTRVISLGPNSFKTIPKPSKSFVHIDSWN